MKKNWRPILALITISIVFTELLTGNLSIDVMLGQPIILLFLILIGYGVPILLIRELFVRWKVGFPSMILLGLAYGIWNEGILAKTLLMNENVPVETFDGYVAAFGINIAWAFMISAWHAFHAVIYPILLITFLYQDNQTSWFSKWSLVGTGAVVLFLGGLFYFTNNEVVIGTQESFVPMVGTMAGLTILAYLLRGWQQVLPSSRPTINRFLIYGAGFIALLLLGTSSLAENAVPTLGIVLAVLLLLVWSILLFSKHGRTIPNIALFGLGDYMLSGVFTIVFVGLGNPVVLVTILVLEVIFFSLARKLQKSGVRYVKNP